MKQRILLFTFVSIAAFAQQKTIKPGWNLFSKDQDVQLGKEAAAQVRQQMQVINNPDLTALINRIGKSLTSQPQADNYPYTFEVVHDLSINAFALPGGPAFVHTGLIASADSEAQLAGVLAHEISHVALRHGTNQASKANLLQIPAMLAGAVGGGGLLGQMAQLGAGLGANSLILKFSRSAESDADILGARMMAAAGYNPLELAKFFEKLEAETGGKRQLQFLSDHPNPGNRRVAIEKEVRYLPKVAAYSAGDQAQFERARAAVRSLPAPKAPAQVPGAATQQSGAPASAPAQAAAGAVPNIQLTGRFKAYQGAGFAINTPDDWDTYPGQSGSVTLAPKQGIGQSGNGNWIGYGAMAAYAQAQGPDLATNTNQFLQNMAQSQGMTVTAKTKAYTVGGQAGTLTVFTSTSPYQNSKEYDVVVTTMRPQGLWYAVLIAPESQFSKVQATFENMLRSIKFQ